jgi:long-subunit acyl-CoA synthetase (AMP-forming)
MSLVLEKIQIHNPANLALIGETQKLTYGEVQREIAIRESQLSSVAVLGLLLDNSCDWILWDLAAVQADVVCVPIPPFFTQEQIGNVIQRAGISHIISAEGMTPTGVSSTDGIHPKTAKVTFTSGTTGDPKGVCLSQQGMEQVAVSLVGVLGAEMAKRHMSILPLAVLLENVAGVYATLIAGGTVYLPSLETIGFENPFQPEFHKLAAYLKRNEITTAIVVPELLRGLLAVQPDLPQLEFMAVGGSKISPLLIAAARQAGLPVYEGYGLSECASVVSLNTPENDQPGSVGKLLPHIELQVQEGEIMVKNSAFLGYLGERHSGEYSTGDLGQVDRDGFLRIDGRKKNTLITSFGRNISPEWVESLLLSQPEILQVIVYGDGQPFLSALIVPASVKANIEEALQRSNHHLPEYAQIKNFQLVAPFTVAEGTLTGTARPRREQIIKNIKGETL